MQKLNKAMMIRRIIGFILLAPSIVFAQSYFGPAPGTPSSTPSATTNQPLSADDFKSKVQSLDQETKNRIAQQVNQQTPKPNSGPATTSITTSPPDTDSDPSNSLTNSTSPPPAQTNAALTPPPAPDNNGIPANRQRRINSSPSVNAPPTIAPQQQSNVYTGFGTPGSSNSPTTSPSNNNGSAGWNIKY